jgi:hypothetical protein
MKGPDGVSIESECSRLGLVPEEALDREIGGMRIAS